MTKYDIEIGDNSDASICPCCGRESRVGHGFIHKDGDAYAVYYVAWSTAHFENKVSIALAIGEWGDHSTNNDRTCFGLEVYEGQNEILFRVIEPTESPWPDTELMGKMLARDEALGHWLLKEVFVIAEYIVRNHNAISEYLNVEIEGS